MNEPSAFGGVAACSVERHVGSQDFYLKIHRAVSLRDANPEITTNSSPSPQKIRNMIYTY